jgi:hypothetical protein
MAKRGEGGSMHMTMDEGEDAYRVSSSAYDEMLRRGIKLPARPQGGSSDLLDEDGVPIIPIDIVELSESRLGELSTYVQLYYSYVIGQLADVKNKYKEAKEQHEFVSSEVRLTKDGTSADKEARKITDRRYVMSRAKAFELECLHNLLNAVVDSWDANWKLISRLITVREQEIKKGARHAHIETVRRMSDQIRDRDSQPRRLSLPPSRPSQKPPPRRKPPQRTRDR